MIPYERQQKILELLENAELLKIDYLIQEFSSVSESTLRRDLKELEKQNKIELLAGGAVKKISTEGEIPIADRHVLHNDEKTKIAEAAAKLIHDGDTIYLDSGTSCYELFKHISDRHITIYTSNTAMLYAGEPFTAEVIVLPGRFNRTNLSVSGSMTESALKDLYFNKCFLGVNGVDEKFGFTTPSVEEANKKKLVKSHSDQCYILCDSSKFHKLTSVKVFDLRDVTVISDQPNENISSRVKMITE